MKRKIKGIVLLVLLVAGTAEAQFFSVGPMWTFDPIAIGKIILETEKILQLYVQMQQLYQVTLRTYDVIKFASQAATGKYGWQYLASPIFYPRYANTYGTSGGWMDSLSKGINTVESYERATMRYVSPYELMGRLGSIGQDRYARQYATVEIMDGTAQHAMNVSGSIRAQNSLNSVALWKLEQKSLSQDPDDNSEVSVLNKVNAATMIQARMAQEQINLQGAILDQNNVELKRKHDLMIEELNAASAINDSAVQTTESIWSGHSAARNMRLP